MLFVLLFVGTRMQKEGQCMGTVMFEASTESCEQHLVVSRVFDFPQLSCRGNSFPLALSN